MTILDDLFAEDPAIALERVRELPVEGPGGQRAFALWAAEQTVHYAGHAREGTRRALDQVRYCIPASDVTASYWLRNAWAFADFDEVDCLEAALANQASAADDKDAYQAAMRGRRCARAVKRAAATPPGFILAEEPWAQELQLAMLARLLEENDA